MERVLLIFEDCENVNEVIEMDPNVQGYTKDGYTVTDVVKKGGKVFLYLELK